MPDTLTSLTEPAYASHHVTSGHAVSRTKRSLGWAPADYAYIVLYNRPAGQRLCMFTRGRQDFFIRMHPDNTDLSEKELTRLANQLNRDMGVRPEAAKALFADWHRQPYDLGGYVTSPRLVTEHDKGKKALKRARRGHPSGETAPDGWLRFKLDHHYVNALTPLASLRAVELAAFFEARYWAEPHGRKTLKAARPSERSAIRVNRLRSALYELEKPYRPYSRREAETALDCHDSKRHAEIMTADQHERRKALLALRVARRPVLRAFIKAVVAYRKARAAVFAADFQGA